MAASRWPSSSALPRAISSCAKPSDADVEGEVPARRFIELLRERRHAGAGEAVGDGAEEREGREREHARSRSWKLRGGGSRLRRPDRRRVPSRRDTTRSWCRRARDPSRDRACATGTARTPKRSRTATASSRACRATASPGARSRIADSKRASRDERARSPSATPSAARFARICAGELDLLGVLELVHDLPVAHGARVVGGEVLEQMGRAAGLVLGGGRVGGAGGRRPEDGEAERNAEEDGASDRASRLRHGSGTSAPEPRAPVPDEIENRIQLSDRGMSRMRVRASGARPSSPNPSRRGAGGSAAASRRRGGRPCLRGAAARPAAIGSSTPTRSASWQAA